MTLEEILQKWFNCKKPFLKNPYYDGDEKAPVTMTKWGAGAYSELIQLIYAVGELTETDVNDIVDTLDLIIDEM